MPKHRLESFSDGVFAIVITLLILNVHLDRDQELTLQSLASLGPEMLAFALTFVIVGVYWVSHHSMMHMIKAVDRRLLWLNLLLLLAVVFIPFPAYLRSSCGQGLELGLSLHKKKPSQPYFIGITSPPTPATRRHLPTSVCACVTTN
jgi:uncharacterized membrane protein